MSFIKKHLTWTILFILGILTLIIGFILPFDEDQGFSWTHFNGFYVIFGFVGCIIIIIVAKLLGRYWLQKKEDHYD